MTNPQQPELRRAGRGATDEASAKSKADMSAPVDGSTGAVPPENRPGHHPEHEQDKPDPGPAPH